MAERNEARTSGRDTVKVSSGYWFFPEGVDIRGAAFRPGSVLRLSDEEAERLQKGEPLLAGEPTTPVKMEKSETPFGPSEERSRAREKWIIDMTNAQAEAIKLAAKGEAPKGQYPEGPSMSEIVAKRKEIRKEMDEREAFRASLPQVALVAPPASREAPSARKS